MDEDGVIVFIPYGSRLGFHVGGPASTMANIDYKFPQCVCYEGKMREINECWNNLNFTNPVLVVLKDQDGQVIGSRKTMNSSGGDIATTLDSHYFKGQGEREGIEREFIVMENNKWYCCGNGQSVTIGLFPVSNSLDCMHDQKFIVGENKLEENDGRKYILRRLTPMECARLQGFPDWWTDGVEGSDSAIYKMWGNGIALPCAADVLGRIAKEVQGWPVKTNNADAEVSAK